MAEVPWIRWFTADFLTEVADLDADEIGVYAVIKNLMADRGGPIEDDAKWLARRCGTSTRRFNQIRAKLLTIPGLLILRNGMLGHRKLLAEVDRRDGKSQQARTAALTRWHHEGEPELPLAAEASPVHARAHGAAQEPGKKGEKKGQTSREQIDLIPRKSGHNPQKTANSADAPASPPVRAREEAESEERLPPQPNPEGNPPVRARAREAPAPDRLGDHDLQALHDAVCEAAGFHPISPTQLDRSFRIVQEWRDAGFDFEAVVLPTIRATVADARDPTRTLGRFTPAIRHEHARRKARGEAGRSYAPPPSPILDVPGEEPVMRTIREDVLKAVGAGAYCVTLNHARLEAVTDVPAGRRPLRATDTRNGGGRVLDGPAASALSAIAKRHGFNEVW